ncbi:glutathione S-transferase family protein [Pseudomonas sp. 5P_3.1_Bac2]|uniref:glutathione S-transferase family protein n=1 Tax=Pseudomonas sp. 5P_3.1_Bac2 TaxID=2971617 RepID=UPI0021C638BC|nr:glutathione S-transferase N-terminal domain-containing protein [Pseudomonas sp. 5P_3.1_Bac2]MCU1719517.1 glutathione S-transferase N-terminal domain-containing protein [Pseudomonas sp. 5P_3.1_Bac2]
MLQIWGRRSAFNVQKVLWLLDELQLDYQHIDAGGDFGLLDTPEFLAMNPHGRVPLLKDGDSVLWESHSILRYLAAQYGASQFWPAAAAQRAVAESWMDWAQCSLQPCFIGGVFWLGYRTPEAQQDKAVLRAKLELCNQYFVLLDGVLAQRPFLAGEQLSLADIPAGTHLYRYFELEIERPSLPHVEAWYARLQTRPAYRQHVMRPFAELRGKLAF